MRDATTVTVNTNLLPYVIAFVVVVCLAFVAGCASGQKGTGVIPVQLRQTAKEACAAYNTLKPKVIELRTYAAANWNSLPPNVQATLKEIDSYLPQLDKAGQDVCLAADILAQLDSTSNAQGKSALKSALDSIDWGQTLSTVMKVATLYIEAKNGMPPTVH